jgi:flagellar hook-basal body complex protein FliE
MSIDPVSLSAILPAGEQLGTLAPAPLQQPASGFGALVTDGLNAVNATLVKADSEVRQVALGGGPSLHEVMIHLEEARLSFQLLAQVRNRLLDAYQEVMRMQV